jgi:D-alanine-D-alanine ligase
MPKPRVLVLYNQPVLPPDHPEAGSEHDVLETAKNTATVLAAAGFGVRQLGVGHDPRPLLADVRRRPPVAVFNLFEGLATQTATEVAVAALLEWLNVPFTGCPSACLALGRDKIRTKHLLAAAGLPTPEYLVVESGPAPRWPHPWPAIVKPACQDASVGIDQGSVVTAQAQLADRVRYVLDKYGGPVLAERFVDGREFHVNLVEAGVAGDRPVLVLPLAEIAFTRDGKVKWPIYSYTAKWDERSDEFRAAPLRTAVELPAEAMRRLRDIGERAFRLLLCRDYARLDVRMTPAGEFTVLEVNPNPYLNSLALIRGLEAVGRTHEQLIVDMALAAAARGGVEVPAAAVTVPVGVSSGGY